MQVEMVIAIFIRPMITDHLNEHYDKYIPTPFSAAPALTNLITFIIIGTFFWSARATFCGKFLT